MSKDRSKTDSQSEAEREAAFSGALPAIPDSRQGGLSRRSILRTATGGLFRPNVASLNSFLTAISRIGALAETAPASQITQVAAKAVIEASSGQTVKPDVFNELGEDISEKAQIAPEWQGFNHWYSVIDSKQRMQIRKGQVPDGTPLEYVELVNKTTADERLFGSMLGDYPSIEEVRSRTVEQVREMENQKHQERRVKLAARANQPSDTTMSDSELAKEAERIHGNLMQQVDGILAKLDPIERQVTIESFGLNDGKGKTAEEISKTMGLPVDQVREIEERALSKLRRPENTERLHKFLD